MSVKRTSLATLAALGLEAAPAIAVAADAGESTQAGAADAKAEAERGAVRNRVGRTVPVLPDQADEDTSRIGWKAIRSSATDKVQVGKDKSKTHAHVILPPGAPVVAELYAGDPSRGWKMEISEKAVAGQRNARLVNLGNGYYQLHVTMPAEPGQEDVVTLVCTRANPKVDDTHELNLHLEARALDDDYDASNAPPAGAASEEEFDDEHDGDDAAVPQPGDAVDDADGLRVQAYAALAFNDSIAFDTDADIGALVGVDLCPEDQENLKRLMLTAAYRFAASNVRVVREDGSQFTVRFPTHALLAGGAWTPQSARGVFGMRLGLAVGVAAAQGVETGEDSGVTGDTGVAGRADVGIRLGGQHFAFIAGMDLVISKIPHGNYFGGFAGLEFRN